MKKKKLGIIKTFVHGKEKSIVCHDMRKYVWDRYNKIEKKKKNKRP